jgi:hypothetical protein
MAARIFPIERKQCLRIVVEAARPEATQPTETLSMTIPKLPEAEPASAGVIDGGIREIVEDPLRLTGGAWLSLVLSIAFFLIMIVLGALYDRDHHARIKPADAEQSALSGSMAKAPAIVVTQVSTPPIDAPDVLLERAHDCAANARWDCVVEAVSGVIAQRGDTPEARALLVQAVVNEGWVPSATPAPAPAVKTHRTQHITSTPAGATRATKHVHRHSSQGSPLPYTAPTRSAVASSDSTDRTTDIPNFADSTSADPGSGNEVEDLYRH